MAKVHLREYSGPLLFVVQQHRASHMHYDLRLECDGVLKSWAVPKGLSLDPSEKRFAAQTEDHPYEYAEFEGVIPQKQYGAGEMIVWDCGVYSPDEGNVTYFEDRKSAESEVREGLANGKLGFQLRGEKLKGSFALVRMKDPKQWLVIKHKDRFVSTEDVTARDRSVLSGVTVAEVKAAPPHGIPAARLVPAGKPGPMPAKVAPMLAERADAAFDDADWIWEPKLDGRRVIAFIGAKGVRLRDVHGADLSEEFPRLCVELAKQGSHGMVLDGELVALGAAGDTEGAAVFCCFDLLHFAGTDLRAATYRDRRRYLTQCLLPSRTVQLIHASQDGVALASAARASGFEGVVGKRLDSRYEAGKRSASWIAVTAGKPRKARAPARKR